MPNKFPPWGAANTLFFWQPLVKPLYGTWSSFETAVFITQSIASSTVAPVQPPCPPHCFGFGVHSTISCSEKVRILPLISVADCRTVTAATAQQEPQAPWFHCFWVV